MKTRDYIELIGIGAVVISLLLVTYELRQNTMATEQAAAANYTEDLRDLELFVAGNPEFAAILQKSVDGDELTSIEQIQISLFYRSLFRALQNSYMQNQAGTLNDDLWSAELYLLEGVLQNDKGISAYWSHERAAFGEQFRHLVDDLLEPTPN